MVVTALVFTACQCVVLTCFIVAGHFWFENQKRKAISELTEFVRSLVEAPDSSTPSPLAALIDQGALLLAARLVQQVKAMLAGVESGASKGEQLALIQEASQASPWLSLIVGMLPNRLRNQLLKNPQMVAALSKMARGNQNHQEIDAPTPRRHRE